MKKIAIILMILVALSMLPVFTNHEVQIIENLEATNLSSDWVYYENMMLTPDTVQFAGEGVPIALKDLINSDFTIDLDRKQGTLYKQISLSSKLVSRELGIYNNAFKENFKIYINDTLLVQQGHFTLRGEEPSLSLYQSVFHFIPDSDTVDILIQFDQSNMYPSEVSELFIGGTKDIQQVIYVKTFLEFLKLSLWLCIVAISIPQFRKKNLLLYNIILSFALLLRILSTKETLFLQYTSLPLVFAVKLGILSHIFIHVFILLRLFNQKTDWRLRSDLFLIGYAFISVLTLLMVQQINLYLWVYLNIPVMVGIYLFNFKHFKARMNVVSLIVIMGFYVFDLMYQLLPWLNQLYLIFFMLVALFFVSKKLLEVMRPLVDDDVDIPANETVQDIGIKDQSNMVKMILRSMSEGYIYVNESLLVNQLCSDSALDILGKGVKYKKITDVLFGNDMERKGYVEDILDKVFSTNKWGEKQLYLDLLPREVIINGRFIHLQFKCLDDDPNLIIIMTDHTDNYEVINQTKLDREQMNMIVEVMRNHNEFIELKHNYDQFVSNDIMNSAEDVSNIFSMWLHKIHFYKEQFSKFKLTYAVKKLSTIESELMEIRNATGVIPLDSLRAIIRDYAFEDLLTEDLILLQDYMVDDVNLAQGIVVNRDALDKIEDKIRHIEDKKVRSELLNDFWAIRHQKLSVIAAQYETYILDLAKSVGKKVKPLIVEGKDILIDEDYYRDFIKSFSHLFNNALEHGIELPSERFRRNKTEYGQMTIKMNVNKDFFDITFTDDGKGIDPEEIRNCIVTSGIKTIGEIDALSDDEIIQFVFLEGITTNVYSMNFGGKGLGLARLASEVEKLGGDIRVSSRLNDFTSFHIKIPNIDVKTVEFNQP